MEIGSIESLWRYPVKSLMGETLKCLEFDERGAVDDRLYALIGDEGKIGSGKDTRRFKRIDGLLSLASAIGRDGLSISFPDGATLGKNDEGMDSKLSQLLGQELRLSREQQTPYFDDSAVHIFVSRTLSSLQEELAEADVDVRRFRPNIVLDTALTDEELVGNTLKMGEVILGITHRTARCRMITLEQIGLRRSPEILKNLVQKGNLLLGTYAKVLSAGTIRVGDRVELLS